MKDREFYLRPVFEVLFLLIGEYVDTAIILSLLLVNAVIASLQACGSAEQFNSALMSLP